MIKKSTFSTFARYSLALLWCLVVSGICGASAQSATKSVNGKIVDEKGQPLVGVSVIVEGTVNGTATGADGTYLLKGVKDSDKLQFIYLGYKTVVQEVGTKTEISVTMTEDTSYLDEVVVIGYGTTTRRHITSAISTVNREDLADRPVANIQQALQGTAANLIIQNRNYDPTGGDQMNISIRGINTMGNNSPLVVIDGVPQADASRMNDLNPNDIESVNILKDAGSAAIYGARSSNGVILITTKQGHKETAPTISFSAQLGAQEPHILFEHVPSYKNSILRNEALTNSGRSPIFTAAEIQDMYIHGDSESFVEQAMKNALQQNYNVSVTGGTEHSTYMLSAGYFDQESNYIGPDYGRQRYNVRSNLSTEWGRLKVSANLSYTRAETKSPTTSGFLFANLSRYPTYYFFRSMDDNGIFYANNYKWGGCGAELAGLVGGGYNKYDNDYLNGIFNAEFEIIKGLKIRGVLSAESRTEHRFSDHMTYYVVTDNGANWSDPSTAVLSGSTTTPADDWVGRDTYLNGQVLLDFNRTFAEKHNVTALVGWSQESKKHYSINASKTYLNDLNQPGEGTVTSDSGTSLSTQDNTRSALQSYFGRIGYSYDDKYYVEFTARYDMSSKFLKERNGGFFPAVSVGWRISQEEFMGDYHNKIGDLKFRASYGINGNQQNVGLYDFMTTYGIWTDAYGFNGSSVPGLMFTMGNEALTWERSKTFNVGLDASFFRNTLNINFDYFYKRTSDILLDAIVPGVFGASIAKENRGVMDNQGWELTINYDLNHGAWKHRFSLNLADSKNEVVTYGTPNIASVDGVTAIIQEGLPLNSYYGYKVAGYFSNYEEIQNAAIPSTVDRSQLRPGDVQYVDINGDGVIDEDDRTYLGYAFPRYTYGFSYNVSWKGIDLGIMLQGVMKRTQAIRGELVQPFHSDYGMTMYEHQLDYWTPENTDARWPRLAAKDSTSDTNNWGQPGSELNMVNTAYLRVKNIQIGYTLPEKWTKKFGCKSLRIYLDAQNPLTFTKYGFFDPESSEFGSNMSKNGANSLRNYPTLRYWGGGINLTF
ncbi:TonB-dependent receptor [uncultured Alistipes sp.]|uniref:SusC/RagA family TonB-linked outer membrane protein n=1 Tax=uncultured Alistipes sp. TaxID=538949 RepID=UPI003208AB4C